MYIPSYCKDLVCADCGLYLPTSSPTTVRRSRSRSSSWSSLPSLWPRWTNDVGRDYRALLMGFVSGPWASTSALAG